MQDLHMHAGDALAGFSGLNAARRDGAPAALRSRPPHTTPALRPPRCFQRAQRPHWRRAATETRARRCSKPLRTRLHRLPLPGRRQRRRQQRRRSAQARDVAEQGRDERGRRQRPLRRRMRIPGRLGQPGSRRRHTCVSLRTPAHPEHDRRRSQRRGTAAVGELPLGRAAGAAGVVLRGEAV